MSQQKSNYVDDADIDADLDQLPDDEAVEATVENFETSGSDVIVVDTADEALGAVQSHIPVGVSAMSGHSTTLEEIRFDDYLSEGGHEWENLSDQIWGIDDDAERQATCRDPQTADYLLGGISAIVQAGGLVAAGLSGSRVGAYPFAASNVVIVNGINRIVPMLDDTLNRLESVAYPLENERAKEAYGAESTIAKQLIFRQEVEEGRATVVLIRERLGY